MMDRLEFGDCFDLLPSVSDRSVHLVLCDLPYGTTQNKWDSVLDLERLWKQWERVLVPGGATVLTAAEPFTSTLVYYGRRTFECEWIWKKSSKTGHLNARKRPMREHENILVFRTPGGNKVYNPQGLVPYQKRKWRGTNGNNFGVSTDGNWQEWTNYPSSIIAVQNESKVVHPTQKPVALFEYLIRTYTNPGDTVLDCCGGSGTTAIAAYRSGRGFIVFEKDSGYWEAAYMRLLEEQDKGVGVDK